MSQANPSELKKRSDELDRREREIRKKEVLLNAPELTARVEVLNKQIEANHAVLEEQRQNIANLNTQLQDRKDDIQHTINQLEDVVKSKKADIDKLDYKISVLDDLLAKQRKERDALHDEIKQSKEYLKEQVALVDNTIADLNIQLIDFNAELDRVQKDKNLISGDIIRLDQDKSVLTREVFNIEEKLQDLDSLYNDKVAEYRNSLNDLQKELVEKQKALDNIKVKYKSEITALQTREKTVKVKEVANLAKEQELSEREKRLRMNFAMQDISFDDDIMNT